MDNTCAREVEMSTSYEHGWADGQWTDEQIKECGFVSAQECLAHEEAEYEKERAKLADLYARNPVYAAQHAEYLEGWIAGARASLRGR
jgi:hypothetical protein